MIRTSPPKRLRSIRLIFNNILYCSSKILIVDRSSSPCFNILNMFYGDFGTVSSFICGKKTNWFFFKRPCITSSSVCGNQNTYIFSKTMMFFWTFIKHFSLKLSVVSQKSSAWCRRLPPRSCCKRKTSTGSIKSYKMKILRWSCSKLYWSTALEIMYCVAFHLQHI